MVTPVSAEAIAIAGGGVALLAVLVPLILTLHGRGADLDNASGLVARSQLAYPAFDRSQHYPPQSVPNE